MESMPKKILVADDSRIILKVMRRSLEAEGYSVVEASDGLQALNLLGSDADVGLVICDLRMPQMGGLDLLEAIQKGNAQSHAASPKFVIMSSDSDPALASRAKQLGASGWLMKPATPDRLLRTARKLLGG